MRAGAARVDITPAHPVPLAGFSTRGGRPISRVSAPLWLRALVLESQGRRIVVVSAELLNWPRELVDEHRVLVAGVAACDPDDVVLTATHTHSAPQPNMTVTPAMGPVDPPYLEGLSERVRTVTEEAVRALTRVSAFRGDVEHRLGEYRRDDAEGDGPRDDLLTTVHFADSFGRTVGGMVHYTCHPVISAEDAVSGDFPGFACSALEREHGGVFLYLQGCCGDVDPAGSTAAGLERARIAGEQLAGAASRAMAAARRIDIGDLAVHRHEVRIRLIRDLDVVDDGKHGTLRAEWRKVLAEHPARQRDAETLIVHLVRIGVGVGLLCLSGEPSVEYGTLVRRVSAGTLLPVGYANGNIGYLPRASQVREGGYESVQAAFYYATAGRFGADIEAAIESAIGLVALDV
jgi:hypothetical protein